MVLRKGETPHPPTLFTLSEKDFRQLGDFITDNLGIKMPDTKRSMLSARLQHRLRRLQMHEYSAYRDYLFSDVGMRDELPHLFDVVTTNTTHFFREPNHFDVLTKSVLPKSASFMRPNEPLRVWSAGCSTGEEPYTLAMVLADYMAVQSGFRYEIFASDISTRVLNAAHRGVYTEEKAAGISGIHRKKYLLRSKDRTKSLVRIVPELRKRITFQRINFMEQFSLPHTFHVVFCRNVVIYFDKATQKRLFTHMLQSIVPGGFLFIGHSESLSNLGLPLTQVAPTVYRKG